MAVRPTPFATTDDGVEAGVEALLAAVAEALEELGSRLAGVVAVGIAGLAESGAALDGAGLPLGPVIAWHDPRGAEVVERLEQRFGDDVSLAMGQRLRTVSSVAKLGWQVAHGAGAARCWLGVPELCLHRLTGERATDFSLAARTGAYDVGRRAPMPEVLAVLGLPEDMFLSPVAAGSVMGAVSPCRRSAPRGPGWGPASLSPSPDMTTWPAWWAPAPALVTWATRWARPSRWSAAARRFPTCAPPSTVGPSSRCGRTGTGGRCWPAGPGRAWCWPRRATPWAPRPPTSTRWPPVQGRDAAPRPGLKPV